MAINSWQGIGFVYSNSGLSNLCKCVINTRTGNLSTLGAIQSDSLTVSNAVSCGAISCSSITIINSGAFNSVYRNNIKNYNIKGYSSKGSNVNNYSWLLSSDQSTYTTSSIALAIDSGCFSISVLYTYYSTGTYSYQGATPYYIIKFSNGSWIIDGGNSANTQGSFECQPNFSVSSGNLNITHNAVLNNNDFVYFFYKIEMY